VYDGEKIIDQYDTLVNPERSIPANITRITGITNEMVKDAPKFYEVAKRVVELTEGRVFVAHNVRFDYGFLRSEFERLGYTFSRRQLCTVRLSRTSFPGLRSYSLGNLIKHFDIDVSARHRALEDTLATLKVFKHILEKKDSENHINDFINKGIRESQLPAGITIDYLHELPQECGVYYFLNGDDKIIYVGKSINIQKRAFQHFRSTTAKAVKMAARVRSISFELTGSELVSLLLESKDIKRLSPEINKAQKTKSYPYFIYRYRDEHGFICFESLKNNSKNIAGKEVLSFFKSKLSAVGTLRKILKEFTLCDNKTGQGAGRAPCFSHEVGLCYGACFFGEDISEYNERAEQASNYLQKIFDESFVLIDKGRNPSESSVILVEEGNYKGYGYISNEDVQYGIEELKEAIKYESLNYEANQIIRSYLYKNPKIKKIAF
jgi:DNA polymerase-3 subunit epsilon